MMHQHRSVIEFMDNAHSCVDDEVCDGNSENKGFKIRQMAVGCPRKKTQTNRA
jgi:hypothetical protein